MDQWSPRFPGNYSLEKNQPPLLNRAISHLLPPCSFNFPSFNDPLRRGIDK